MGGFRLKVLCLKLELEMWKATYRIWMCAPSGNLRVSLQVKSMLLRAMSIPAQDFAIVPAYATQGRRTNEHRGHESSIGTCPRHGSPVCIALARRRRSTSEGASKRPFPVRCEYGFPRSLSDSASAGSLPFLRRWTFLWPCNKHYLMLQNKVESNYQGSNPSPHLIPCLGPRCLKC